MWLIAKHTTLQFKNLFKKNVIVIIDTDESISFFFFYIAQPLSKVFGSKTLADPSCAIPPLQVWRPDGKPSAARVHKKRRSSKPCCSPAQLFCASWPRPQDV